MFLLNSRHPLLCATRRWLPNAGPRLSRSYASKLPSSFGIVLSSASVCSTGPPVSVSGTVFLEGCFQEPLSCKVNPIRPHNTCDPSPSPGRGILTPFPSTTALALALGAGSPRADEPCAGTLGLPATGILAPFVATHVSIRTPDTSRTGHPCPFDGLRDAPLPRAHPLGCAHPRLRHVASDPLHLRRGVSVRPVSYYAFFKGWLLLSQPPGCRGVPTSFPT